MFDPRDYILLDQIDKDGPQSYSRMYSISPAELDRIEIVNIGPVALTLPDLADPGYRGESEPLTTEMHFNYTGWVRAQKIVPATILKVGANDLVITNAAGTSASAIRATQIQLKYIWDKSDYLLRTGP